MAFEQVVGQHRVKQILEASLTRNRLAHAYLFYGQPGVGKDAMAVSMVMGLSCKEGIVGGCGECSSCLSILKLEHPNFHLVLPVPTRPRAMKEEKYREILTGKAVQRVKNPYQEVSYSPELSTLPIIGIDHIRAMKREVMLKVSGGSWRVFLVSHADRLTIPAANSLLKLLEEPPLGTLLFLTTVTPRNLMKTIVSRCQTVRFDPLPEEEIEDALVTLWTIPSEKAKFISRMAGGSLQRALKLVKEEFEVQRKTALMFLEKSLEGDLIWCADVAENLSKQWDKLEIQEIFRILQLYLRDLLHLNLGFSQRVMNFDQMELLKRFMERWPGFDFDEGIKCVERAIDFIEKNVYLSLIIYSLSQELKRCWNP